MKCQCLNQMIVAVVRSKWLLPGLVTSDRSKTSLVSFESPSSTTFLSLGWLNRSLCGHRHRLVSVVVCAFKRAFQPPTCESVFETPWLWQMEFGHHTLWWFSWMLLDWVVSWPFGPVAGMAWCGSRDIKLERLTDSSPKFCGRNGSLALSHWLY